MQNNRGRINSASISDIHLGHKKNPTKEIIANLKKAFPETSETAELDIIYIAGDVFDNEMYLSDDDVVEINIWISWFILLCKRYDILLRVLEGTPSHDRRQSKLFAGIAKILECEDIVKYVSDLSIEYIEKLGINVLYVPDEWDSDTNKTLDQVKALMGAKGLEKVDYAVMHGTFKHQLPEHTKTHKHDPDEYLKLVKHFIYVGHIHNYSKYDRVLAQGSFDRLSHGEEGAKGHLRTTVEKDGSRKIMFIENRDAKIFKTINCIDLDMEDSLEKIDKEVTGLPDGSHVRVSVNHDNPLVVNINLLVRKYPLLIWTKLVEDKTEEISELLLDDEEVGEVFIPITITNNNIKALLMEKVANENVSAEVLASAEEILTEIV